MKKILSLFGIMAITLTGCGDPDNTINEVLDNVGTGAVLRTISSSGSFNFYDQANSVFSATIEAHDTEDGGLMQNVEIYLSADGGAESLFRTMTPSDFTTGPTGLPRGSFQVSLADFTAAGINYGGASVTKIRLQYNLTNGESYSDDTVTGSMTGSYFASPYAYSLLVACLVTDGSAVPGVYTFTMTDSYGDGWQQSTIKFTIDGVVYNVANPSIYDSDDAWEATLVPFSGNASAGTAQVTVPAGASTMSIEFVEGRYPGETGWSVDYVGLDGSSNAQNAYSGGGGYSSAGVKTLSICQ